MIASCLCLLFIWCIEPLAVNHGEDCYFDRFGGHLEDIISALELFRASQLLIYPHESYLDDYASRAKLFLKQKISDNPLQADGYRRCMIQEVPSLIVFLLLFRSTLSGCLEYFHHLFHLLCVIDPILIRLDGIKRVVLTSISFMWKQQAASLLTG